METTVLIGAEDVERAGRNMVGAAEEISRAAASIASSVDRMVQAQKDLDYALMNHQRFLDGFLERLHDALEETLPLAGEPIDVRVVKTEEDEAQEHHEGATIRSGAPDDTEETEDWKGTTD